MENIAFNFENTSKLHVLIGKFIKFRPDTKI